MLIAQHMTISHTPLYRMISNIHKTHDVICSFDKRNNVISNLIIKKISEVTCHIQVICHITCHVTLVGAGP